MRFRTTLAAAMTLILTVGGVRAKADAPTTAPVAEFTIDTTNTPEMAEYGKKVKAVAEEWYPKIIALLPGKDFKPPMKITITFKADIKVPAYTQGTTVTLWVDWFTKHPGDLGAVVHELAHVVQHYTLGKRPGWLVEGIADYVRWFNYEPVKKHPHPVGDKAKYDGSYQTTAAFLDWAVKKYDKDLVVKLNEACRRGTYHESLWQDYTGKSLTDLGTEWKASTTAT